MLEGTAVEMFISDFVVEASDRALSRGFLDGMQNILEALGPSSPLVQSAKLVALANVARKQGHKELLEYAEVCYGELLRTYQQTLLSSGESDVSIETLYTAVLLGLYEVRHPTITNVLEPSSQGETSGIRSFSARTRIQPTIKPMSEASVRCYKRGSRLLISRLVSASSRWAIPFF